MAVRAKAAANGAAPTTKAGRTGGESHGNDVGEGLPGCAIRLRTVLGFERWAGSEHGILAVAASVYGLKPLGGKQKRGGAEGNPPDGHAGYLYCFDDGGSFAHTAGRRRYCDGTFVEEERQPKWKGWLLIVAPEHLCQYKRSKHP